MRPLSAAPRVVLLGAPSLLVAQGLYPGGCVPIPSGARARVRPSAEFFAGVSEGLGDRGAAMTVCRPNWHNAGMIMPDSGKRTVPIWALLILQGIALPPF